VCFVLGIHWAEALVAVAVGNNQGTEVGGYLQNLSDEAGGHQSQSDAAVDLRQNHWIEVVDRPHSQSVEVVHLLRIHLAGAVLLRILLTETGPLHCSL